MLSSLLVTLESFPTIKSKWMNLFFMLLLNFGSTLGMSSNSMVWSYALLLKNLVQLWANSKLVLSFFLLLTRISLSWPSNSWGFLLLWLKGGVCLTSWTSTWFSHTFLSRMFLWLEYNTPTISMPFVYAFLRGTSWCIRHFMQIKGCFQWSSV